MLHFDFEIKFQQTLLALNKYMDFFQVKQITLHKKEKPQTDQHHWFKYIILPCV